MNRRKNNQENNSAMQYILLICLLLFSSAELLARTKKNKLILCLAKEEEVIHQGKSTGPIYKLNQTLVNKLIIASDLHVKDFYVDKICESKIYSPSLKLLHFLLTEGISIFNKGTSNDPQDPFVFQLQVGKELAQEAPDIFFRFLSGLQSVTPLPKCLETEIPELQEFYDRAKYLRGDVSEDQVFKEENLINRLFAKLANFNHYFKRCEILKSEKEKKQKLKHSK